MFDPVVELKATAQILLIDLCCTTNYIEIKALEYIASFKIAEHFGVALPWCHMSIMAPQISSNSTVWSTAFKATYKKSKLHTTGLLWVESAGDQWIPLTMGQYYGKISMLCMS